MCMCTSEQLEKAHVSKRTVNMPAMCDKDVWSLLWVLCVFFLRLFVLVNLFFFSN